MKKEGILFPALRYNEKDHRPSSTTRNDTYHGLVGAAGARRCLRSTSVSTSRDMERREKEKIFRDTVLEKIGRSADEEQVAENAVLTR